MFRLALSLGRTVAELERTLSAREFVEWMEVYRIEPFGEEAAFLRSGIVSSTIANCNRGPNQEAFCATDFMPFYREEEEKQDSDGILCADPEQQSQLLMAFFNNKAGAG